MSSQPAVAGPISAESVAETRRARQRRRDGEARVRRVQRSGGRAAAGAGAERGRGLLAAAPGLTALATNVSRPTGSSVRRISVTIGMSMGMSLRRRPGRAKGGSLASEGVANRMSGPGMIRARVVLRVQGSSVILIGRRYGDVAVGPRPQSTNRGLSVLAGVIRCRPRPSRPITASPNVVPCSRRKTIWLPSGPSHQLRRPARHVVTAPRHEQSRQRTAPPLTQEYSVLRCPNGRAAGARRQREAAVLVRWT